MLNINYILILMSLTITGCRNKAQSNEFKFKKEQNESMKLDSNSAKIEINKSETRNIICEGQNFNCEIGIGILVWEGECDSTITFYKGIDKKNKLEVNLCAKNIPFCPIFYKPDYSIFSLSVDSILTDFYRVNVDVNDKLYIKKDSNFVFYKWDKFLKDIATGFTEVGDTNVLKVLKVKGQFIQGSYLETNIKKTIQWKKDNKLLIDVLLLM